MLFRSIAASKWHFEHVYKIVGLVLLQQKRDVGRDQSSKGAGGSGREMGIRRVPRNEARRGGQARSGRAVWALCCRFRVAAATGTGVLSLVSTPAANGVAF